MTSRMLDLLWGLSFLCSSLSAYGQTKSTVGIRFNNDTGLTVNFSVCCPGASYCRSGNHAPGARFEMPLCSGAVTSLSIVLPNNETVDCSSDVRLSTWVDLQVSAACRSVLTRHNVSIQGGGHTPPQKQQGAICGQAIVVVVAQDTGVAIENAPVYINDNKLIGYTSPKGQISVFSRCADPIKTITVAASGFRAKTIPAKSLENAPEFNVALERRKE